VTLAKKGDKGANVLLVTDGEDDSRGQSEAIDKLGARLRTVAIECEIPAASPLRTRAVDYVRINEDQLTDHTSVRVFKNAV
jgi:hypothetical protein